MTDDIPDPDELVKLVGIQTVGGNGETVEKWILEVYSVNSLLAKQRARTYVRRKVPNATNILSPEDRESERQSSLRDFFTNSIDMEYREIEMLVVKPVSTTGR